MLRPRRFHRANVSPSPLHSGLAPASALMCRPIDQRVQLEIDIDHRHLGAASAPPAFATGDADGQVEQTPGLVALLVPPRIILHPRCRMPSMTCGGGAGTLAENSRRNSISGSGAGRTPRPTAWSTCSEGS